MERVLCRPFPSSWVWFRKLGLIWPSTISSMVSLFLSLYTLMHMCTRLDNIDEAYTLIRDLEPGSPHEYILKAVSNAVMGQEHGSVSWPYSPPPPPILILCLFCFLIPSPSQAENIKLAQQYYQLVGTSGSECGRGGANDVSILFSIVFKNRYNPWSSIHGFLFLSASPV